MGLCKCPKRRVTNQFCFEHRVNVCEHCMVTNHAKCIIQSYLQWLQDSDYNPICEICMRELKNEDCIRLTCYHVFHWVCLDHHARQLPATTAPAGYSCPSCKTALFPPSNLVSPVADVLREKLAGVNWARAGLGLPLLSEEKETKPISIATPVSPVVSSTSPSPSPDYSVLSIDEQVPFNREKTEAFQTARRVFQDIRETRTKPFDHDDDKYKRRPASEWLKRWWTNSLTHSHRSTSSSIYRKYMMLGFLVFLVVVVVLLTMSRLGKYYTDNDPELDMRLNPNIRANESR